MSIIGARISRPWSRKLGREGDRFAESTNYVRNYPTELPVLNELLADGSPATIRAELEQSLQLLRLETVDLYQLHTVDPRVPVSESVGALAQMQREGLIKMIGVSNVNVADLRAAQGEARVVSRAWASTARRGCTGIRVAVTGRERRVSLLHRPG